MKITRIEITAVLEVEDEWGEMPELLNVVQSGDDLHMVQVVEDQTHIGRMMARPLGKLRVTRAKELKP